jgi:hypothetical protein
MFRSFRVAIGVVVLAQLVPFSQGQSIPASHSASNATPEVYSSSLAGIDSFASAVPAGEGGAVSRNLPAPAATTTLGPLSRVAIGGYTSPLGVGVGIATPISQSTNVRLGWNFFNYSLTGTDDGASYAGHLHFRSLQASFDWFPFHGKNFHVSPGVLFNNQNRVTATGGVAGGQSFTLNDTNYYSDSADPVTGNGSVHFNSAAPLLTVGWGNWISRREHKHLSFPFEVGFAYTGQATVDLNLKGSVCQLPHDVNCSEIATDPTVQANVNGQIGKLNKDLDWIRFYPIISGGVVYKF